MHSPDVSERMSKELVLSSLPAQPRAGPAVLPPRRPASGAGYTTTPIAAWAPEMQAW